MEFRDAVKYLRSELGLTQSELAAALHVNYATVGRWETGRTLPTHAITAVLMDFARARAASPGCMRLLSGAISAASRGRLRLPADELYAVEPETLRSLIDDATFPLYVCDMETDELLYYNHKAAEVIGKPLSALSSRKCYECLMHRDTPCPFCHKEELSSEQFTSYEAVRPVDGATYQVLGKRIRWNGRNAHVRYFSMSDSGRQFRDIIENIHGGVSAVAYDADGGVRHVYTNARYYAMFGYTSAQFEAELTTPYTVVHPEDAQRVLSVMNEVRATGRPAAFRFRARKRDGSLIHVGCNTSLASVEGLADRVLLSVMTDVSGIVETELQALVNGQRLDAIIRNIQNGVAASLIQEDGSVEYVFVTDRYYELLGYTRAQYRQEVADPFDLIYEQDRAAVRAQAASLKAVGETRELRYRAVRRDGGLIWLGVHIKMMAFADVDKPVMLSVFTDITDMVEAERLLRSQSDQAHEMINATPIGIAIIEADAGNMAGSVHTTYYNDSFFQYTGYNRAEYDALLRRNELSFVLAEDVPILLDATERICAATGGEAIDATVRCRTKDGSYRWLLLTGRLAKRQGNRCVIHIAQMDITKRKTAEDRQRISAEMLRIAAETDQRALITYDIKRNRFHVESRHLYSTRYGDTFDNIPDSILALGIVAPDSEAALRGLIDGIRSGETKASASLQMRNGEDSYGWFACNASTVLDADGQPDQAVLVFHDITEQRLKEAVYRKWQNSINARQADTYTLFRCNLSREASLDEQDGALLRIHFNGEAMAFNQRTREYATQYVLEDDRAAYCALLDSAALLASFYRGAHTATLEYRELDENGGYRWRLLTVEMVEYLNSTDIQAFLLYEDIDERKRAELREKELAETDPLTGALNRAAFSQRVNALLGQEAGSQHALLMLDMDGFKFLNDSFGHAAGDQALMDITAVLRSLTREGDLVCRLGGDEFLVFLRDIAYDAVIRKIAQRICEQTRKAFSLEVQLSASMGMAVYPRDGREFDELYRSADKALYRVKQTGKDGFAFHSAVGADSAAGGGAGAEAPAALAEARTAARPTARTRRRMLVVDSDAESRAMLSSLFEDEYQIETAKNGNDALIRLRHFGSAISVVLLDPDVPGLDGLEALRRIQNNVELRTIPVVIVSGDGDRQRLLKLIEQGAADYVSKPVDAELIRVRVRSAVSRAENERLRAQNSYLQLQRNEELKYHAVLESTGTVVVEYDWSNRVYIYDKTISDYLAGTYDHRGLWQVLLSDLVADSGDVRLMQERMFSLANARGERRADMLVLLKTPKKVRHWFRMNIYKQEDDYGLANRMILTFNDVHEEMLANERLRLQATRDPLTGLYNRAGFIEKAAELIAAREAGYYVMACIDIEKFKVINDQYGTEKGDEVLRSFAEVLQGTNGGDEVICCRIMADNFAVMYPARLLDSGALVSTHDAAETLDSSLSPLKICIGRCIVDDKSLDVSAIYDRAAIAKDTVKGRYDAYVATYDESMRTQILRQQEITGQMKHALENGQFEVWLQPQFNHGTGLLSGAEALVRWRHPRDGIISPAEFIPIFERNGFIYELDKFVWEESCRLLRKWLDQGLRPVPVSVNVSRYDVFREDLIPVVTGLMHKYGLPSDLLRLEITESAFSESADQIIRVVREFVALGFVVEIDDFGSGYSSLNTLKDVPAQVLKMDMRFLENDANSQRGGSIIESVARMAKWLGMSMIAEGVETVDQADYLKSIGCEYVQGYLYSRPAQSQEYEKLFMLGQTERKRAGLLVNGKWNNNEFWNPQSVETLIFNSYVGGACIFEYHGGEIEVIRANEQYAREMGGLTPEGAWLSENLVRYLDEENRRVLHDCLAQAIGSKREAACELRLADGKPDGREEYIRATMRIIAQSGERFLFYCLIGNITAQRQAERRVHAVAEELRLIMESVKSGIYATVYTPEQGFRVVFANDRFYAMFGYTKAQMEAELSGILEVIHPDERAETADTMQRLLREGAQATYECRCVKRDGSVITVSCNNTVAALPGVGDRVLLAILNDVTERVREKQDLHRMLDNLPCGAGVYELHHGQVRLVYQNKRYWELVGLHSDEFHDAAPMSEIHPEDVPAVRSALKAALRQGGDVDCDIRLKHAALGFRPVHLTGRVVPDEAGGWSIFATFTQKSGD